MISYIYLISYLNQVNYLAANTISVLKIKMNEGPNNLDEAIMLN